MALGSATIIQDWYSYSFVQMAVTFLTALKSSKPFIRMSTALMQSDSMIQRSESSASLVSPVNLQPVALSVTYPQISSSSFPLSTDSPEFRRKYAIKMVKGFMEKPYLWSQYRAHHFVNVRGEKVFTQSWTPPFQQQMKAVVVLLHGLNEHSGRYEFFAEALNRRGYGVFCMDWIGHGCSDGLHGYVERLDYIVADVRAYLKMVTTDFPGLPCFLFGHSTGGSIALKAAMQSQVQAPLWGVVLTSPALQIEVPNKALAVLAPLASALFPTFQVPASDKAHAKVSRDPLALEAKYGDPLVYTGSVRARTGWEILSLAAELERNLHTVTAPFLVLHGTADQVTEPGGSRALYERAGSKEKKLMLYEGLLHDLLFEPEKEIITEDILRWLDSRTGDLDSTVGS